MVGDRSGGISSWEGFGAAQGGGGVTHQPWRCPRSDQTWLSGLGDNVGIGQRLVLMVLESFSNLKDSGILFPGVVALSSDISWVILRAVSHLIMLIW